MGSLWLGVWIVRVAGPCPGSEEVGQPVDACGAGGRAWAAGCCMVGGPGGGRGQPGPAEALITVSSVLAHT
eukprot:scaffold5157_cov22-Tisochrysis_lutea.AAC.2